jgi:uncharacterized membrane protein YqjE
MSVPESPSLFVSLRSFWGVLVAIFYTRLDLVTAELEDEAIRLAKFVGACVVSVLCLHTAFFFAMFFLLALVWDTPYRLWILGGVFLVYMLSAFLCIMLARDLILKRPKFLGQTLAELRRDAEGLRAAATSVKGNNP